MVEGTQVRAWSCCWNLPDPRTQGPWVADFFVEAQVPTIGNYLLAAEAFFTERYDLVKEWKDKCENATNTPFANEELCKEKICLYYVTSLEVFGLGS